MKYMLQVRFNGADAAISKLPASEQRAITSEFEEIRRQAGVLDGNQFQHANTAKTVRVHNGRTHATDGPAVDPGAALDGYYIYEAPLTSRRRPCSPHESPPHGWALRWRSDR